MPPLESLPSSPPTPPTATSWSVVYVLSRNELQGQHFFFKIRPFSTADPFHLSFHDQVDKSGALKKETQICHLIGCHRPISQSGSVHRFFFLIQFRPLALFPLPTSTNGRETRRTPLPAGGGAEVRHFLGRLAGLAASKRRPRTTPHAHTKNKNENEKQT